MTYAFCTLSPEAVYLGYHSAACIQELIIVQLISTRVATLLSVPEQAHCISRKHVPHCADIPPMTLADKQRALTSVRKCTFNCKFQLKPTLKNLFTYKCE